MKYLWILFLLIFLLILSACDVIPGDVSLAESGAESSLPPDIQSGDTSSSEVSEDETNKLPIESDLYVANQTSHMQGFAADTQNKVIYWSFTNSLVKTDYSGKMLGIVKFEDGHLGDLAFRDGVIYGTLLGAPADGDAWDAWTGYYVVCYDQYLTRLSKTELTHVADLSTGKTENPNGVYAIDGIAAGKDKLYVAAATKTAKEFSKQVIFEYSYDLQFIKEYSFETGNTPFGIQNLEYDFENNCLWFSTYSAESDFQTDKTLYRVASDFSKIDYSSTYSSPYGIACLGNGYWLVSHDGTGDDGSKIGYALLAELKGNVLVRTYTGYPEIIIDGDTSEVSDEPDEPDEPDDTAIAADSTENRLDLTVQFAEITELHDGSVTLYDGGKLFAESAKLPSMINAQTGASVSMWVNPSIIKGNYVYVGGLQYGDGNYALCLEYCWGQAVLRLYQNGMEYSSTAYCEGAIQINEWTHYLLTLDGSKAIIYVNGTEAGSFDTNPSNVLNDVRYISFGKVAVDASYDMGRSDFIGMLDDICIFGEALTAEDAKTLYEGKIISALPIASYVFSGEEGESNNNMNRPETNGFSIWTENWRNNILQSERFPASASTSAILNAARNDTESFQICCRSSVSGRVNSITASELKGETGSIPASNITARTVGYYKIEANTEDLAGPVLKAPGLVPEKLFNTSACDITLFQTQPFWINCYVPADAKPGKYTGVVTVDTTFGTYTVDISLTVYDVTIPEASEGAFSMEIWNQLVKCFEDVSGNLDVIERAYGVKAYSDEWWSLMQTYAQFMKANRMNVLFVNVVDLLKDAPGTKVASDGKVTYDWSLLDRFVQLFIDEGAVKYISAEHLCAQSVDANGLKSYKLEVIVNAGGVNGKSYIPIDEGTERLEDYLMELNKHLTEKGWTGIWLQHIGDEPTADLMPQKYCEVSDAVRKICPGVRTGDAFYGENAAEFDNSMDVWIPITNLYEEQKEFFDSKKALGETLWLYTASYPSGESLNRFIDQQLFKSELLSWLCFKSGATGYLHWGLMEWYVWEDFSVSDTTMGNNNNRFLGDSWCIYPDRENMDITSSIRVEALREAAEDFELLTLLAKKDQDAADTLVSTLVTDGQHYVSDTEKIAEAHNRLLTLLAK